MNYFKEWLRTILERYADDEGNISLDFEFSFADMLLVLLCAVLFIISLILI